jgi:glycerate 2-kinase
LALGIEGLTSVCALSGDSDGIDGNADASGAFVDGDSAGRARESGLSLDRALAANDTASAFAALGDVFAPGHTGTNVNDFRLILISPRQA